MKKVLRIISILLSVIFIWTCCLGCSNPALPDGMQDDPRGTRSDFTIDLLKSYDVAPTIEESSFGVVVDIEGYEGFDYYNCYFVITFSCLVLYEDMTEEHIEKKIPIKLPYSGVYYFVYDIPVSKPVHAIYEEEYVISNITGEVIKK